MLLRVILPVERFESKARISEAVVLTRFTRDYMMRP